MKRFIVVFLLSVGVAHAQHDAQPAFATQPLMSFVRIEDVTDSTTVLRLPAYTAIVRIDAVIDSAIADVTQLSIGVRGAGTDNLWLLSTIPEGDGVVVPFSDAAGSSFNTSASNYHPKLYVSTTDRICVLHVTTPGGIPVGQLRLFFFIQQFR